MRSGNQLILVLFILLLGVLFVPESKYAATNYLKAKRTGEIQKILSEFSYGVRLLDLMDQYDITISYKEGGGSYYLANSGRIVIDANYSIEKSVLILIHEMLHARYKEEGLRAGAGNLSRDEFVQGKIEEEVEAVIQTIQAKLALQKVGYDFSGVNYPPTEDDYLIANEASERAAIVQSQRTTSMDFGSQRDQAGRKRLLRGFWAGEVRISTTHEPYDEYYQRCWQIADLLGSILGPILTPLGLQNIADFETGREAVNLVSNSC